MDCNYCKYIDFTEEEQQDYIRKNGKLVGHRCMKYKTRIYHFISNAIIMPHNKLLHRCKQCEEEYGFESREK